MLKDVFTLWLQYLRSGAYKGGKFRLIDSNGRYSPLGVLADVLIREYGEGHWKNLDVTHDNENPEYHKGWAWRYKPKFGEVDKETEERKLIPASFAINYVVYLPKEQWFWPGVTIEIQDKIYSWTDSQAYSLSQVSDALEDGKYL